MMDIVITTDYRIITADTAVTPDFATAKLMSMII